MHSPFEKDHEPPRQPLLEAGDRRRCLCLNSLHGRVPRVETVIFLLQKHLGNGRDPGSSVLITSCGSQRGHSRRATTLAAQSLLTFDTNETQTKARRGAVQLSKLNSSYTGLVFSLSALPLGRVGHQTCREIGCYGWRVEHILQPCECGSVRASEHYSHIYCTIC